MLENQGFGLRYLAQGIFGPWYWSKVFWVQGIRPRYLVRGIWSEILTLGIWSKVLVLSGFGPRY